MILARNSWNALKDNWRETALTTYSVLRSRTRLRRSPRLKSFSRSLAVTEFGLHLFGARCDVVFIVILRLLRIAYATSRHLRRGSTP